VSATHVALLRGINVGRAKRIAMADLRALVEKLGYRDVRTLLNSGNVVFSAAGSRTADPAPRIEKAIASTLGVTSRVTVLTVAELADAVDANPLLKIAKDPSRLLLAILTDPLDRKRLEPLRAETWAPEALGLGKRVAYMWCAGGILESRLLEAVGRLLGDAQTARNWATMTKLLALARAPEAPTPGASGPGRPRRTRRARRPRSSRAA
jgi:uncharacterized protein (DUF1697 family)